MFSLYRELPKTKEKYKKKSTSKISKSQILIDPVYLVVVAHDDAEEEKIQEEEANQFHKKRKMIHGADWAEKLQLIPISNNAQVDEEIIAEAQPVITTDTTQVVDNSSQIKADFTNPDSQNLYSDMPELTIEEKKKLLWGSKKPAPVRDSSETINKIYSGNSQSRRSGRTSGLGYSKANKYVADALILRDAANLTEIGNNKKLEDLQKMLGFMT
ncbi:hypothetical protein AgCh_022077 [Apium graveolens]